jgi:hypothetical protein
VAVILEDVRRILQIFFLKLLSGIFDESVECPLFPLPTFLVNNAKFLGYLDPQTMIKDGNVAESMECILVSTVLGEQYWYTRKIYI